MNGIFATIGRRLSVYLTQPRHSHEVSNAVDLEKLSMVLRPADVLVVEGNSRVSTAIKYLTQSTWSHAAIYIGDVLKRRSADGEPLVFIEADVVEGVRAVGLSEFFGHHCRICRPAGLTSEDKARVIAYACGRVGHKYDLKQIFDLARYLFPTPPVPFRWRRRMLALGSGDPTRAICSALIAQAFQSVRYPILPTTEIMDASTKECPGCTAEFHHVRHHSLFVPRDFDVSPYFEVIKPNLAAGFDYKLMSWADNGDEPA